MPRTVFTKGPYGPCANALRHVLTRLEGHFLRGWADGTKNQPDTSISLLPGAHEEASLHLAKKPETHARFDRVSALIEGFETPLGLELLSTVHWMARDNLSLSETLQRVHAWSDRKREFFSDDLIKVAFERLQKQRWFEAATV